MYTFKTNKLRDSPGGSAEAPPSSLSRSAHWLSGAPSPFVSDYFFIRTNCLLSLYDSSPEMDETLGYSPLRVYLPVTYLLQSTLYKC